MVPTTAVETLTAVRVSWVRWWGGSMNAPTMPTTAPPKITTRDSSAMVVALTDLSPQHRRYPVGELPNCGAHGRDRAPRIGPRDGNRKAHRRVPVVAAAALLAHGDLGRQDEHAIAAGVHALDVDLQYGIRHRSDRPRFREDIGSGKALRKFLDKHPGQHGAERVAPPIVGPDVQ